MCMLWESVADALILMHYYKNRLHQVNLLRRQIIRIISKLLLLYEQMNKYPVPPPCVCAQLNKEKKL